MEEELKNERDRIIEFVIMEVRDCVRIFELSQEDIFPRRPVPDGGNPRSKRRKAKYFDPVSGATWSGVGREPKWIRGLDRRGFLINGFDDNSDGSP